MFVEQPIFEKCYVIYKKLFVIANSLEKRNRYSLGVSTENSVLKLSELIMQAKHAPEKTKALYLIKANGELDVVRMKMRLILETQGCNPSLIFDLNKDIDETGRMLGGWLRAHKS